MKNNINLMILVLAFGMLFTSCDKFLDITPKGSEVLTDVSQYAKLFNAETMHCYSQDAFKYIVDDAWVNPLVIGQAENINNYNFCWKTPSAAQPRTQYYTASAADIYVKCFDRINKISNIILDNIHDAKGDDKLRAQTIAEARALRAYNYFVLVNLFGKHYDPATASTDLCVPMWVHFDVDARPEQGTVAKVYQLIEDDLRLAIPDLSNTPQNCYHFSKAAGYALKAKVHLFKKEFDKAEEAALESYNLNHQVFDLVAYNTAGANYTVYVNQNPEYLYYGFASQVTVTTVNGNPVAAISPELTNMFDQVNDIRFSRFFSFNYNTVGTPTGATENNKGDCKFAAAWDLSMTGPKSYFYNSSGLRTTDVILMLAECRARKSDFSDATGMKKYLNEVRVKRIKGYNTTSTGTPADWKTAVDTVIAERRKELLGNFNRFWDLRRLNTESEFKKTLSRTAPANTNPGYTQIPRATYTLTPESLLWTIPLPQEEIGLIYPNMKYNVEY